MSFNFNESVSVLFEKLENLLKSKTIVGETIQIGETTLIPIVNLSFGLGSGGGDGTDDKGSKGFGGGGGIGAKASPTAVIVIRGDKVEILPIKNQGGLEKLIDMVPEIVNKVQMHHKEAGHGKEESCCKEE
ncbi:putative spore protein YtfJ [Anaerosolibacter carboniphilus]|uniref:Putative spore protein YtfJ n=1 Tax=Anaerosolibacter carboniphilus TaxID=1417629 RepID=A0A841KYI5_9FIRM|nr:spore germination protein GerW family protein [Anaerosolibacter carboniphilus]MBB6218846.1 putative spore protein YtfJ [Anaerosolibacter carboniphilus]